MGEGGVINPEKNVDVVYGRSPSWGNEMVDDNGAQRSGSKV